MKKIHLLFFLPVLILIACGGEDPEENPFRHKQSAPEASSTTISTDFNENTFSSEVEAELLRELKLCDPNAKDDTDESHPSCSPKFFRFFRLSEKIPLKDGFILLVKAGVNDIPLRRVLIFQRENDQLIKLNGFMGNLIEQRPSQSGYSDLVVRFADNIGGSLCYYNCLFRWDGGQYHYKLCEAIQEGGQESPHRIKPEYVDSMAPEIKKILDDNQMIF